MDRQRTVTAATAAAGFTLIELIAVLFVVALLAALATPVVTGGIQQARESTLREDLYVLRKAIDDFHADHGRYPLELEELAAKRYVRRIPVDPLTARSDSWNLVREDSTRDPAGGGIVDVRSGAAETARDGTHYRDW